jgi:hypothetical protein
MSDETSQRIFLVGALWNMFGAGLFLLLWRPAFAFFQLEHPNYPAFFQAWLALAFVFGSGYYYVSRGLYGNLHIVRLGDLWEDGVRDDLHLPRRLQQLP